MKVFTDLSEIKEIKNPVVTTGSFDGVHVGHKVIIDRLNKIAKEIDGESVLITFFPHPRKVLFPESVGKDLQFISSQHEKILLLEEAGLQNLVVLKFTKEFSHTTSEEFVRNVLVKHIGARKVIIGFNHYFGHNKEGDFDYLHKMGEELGFEVEEIPEQEIQHETVSSTKIRQALLEGYIQKANAYLDHHYLVSGKLNRNLNPVPHPELNLYNVTINDDTKLVPPIGIYAVNVQVGDLCSKAMVIIQKKTPATNLFPKQLSLYVFNSDDDFCNKDAVISFAKQMSEEIDYDSSDTFYKQICLYKEQIEELIY
ncbi:MAG: hypothetical protein JEZ03_06460 [Bacteroidales bacterium]|nr:hypothetical protein [Bacteroidales bacterium]